MKSLDSQSDALLDIIIMDLSYEMTCTHFTHVEACDSVHMLIYAWIPWYHQDYYHYDDFYHDSEQLILETSIFMIFLVNILCVALPL